MPEITEPTRVPEGATHKGGHKHHAIRAQSGPNQLAYYIVTT
jgi:hypothetical protein